jgi:hypothetical protein
MSTRSRSSSLPGAIECFVARTSERMRSTTAGTAPAAATAALAQSALRSSLSDRLTS